MAFGLTVEQEGLALWTDTGDTWLNFVVVLITGDTSYGVATETIDVSTYLDDPIYIPNRPAIVTPHGSTWWNLDITNLDPAALVCRATSAGTEAAGGTNLSSASWRAMLWGTKTIP